MHKLTFLKKIHIFSDLGGREMADIVPYLKPFKAARGSVLFIEGDKGDELFIVRKGNIASTIRLPDGTQKQIAQFKGGNFFGEMAIFENAPRSATCIALEKSDLYTMHKDDFYQALESHPEAAIAIMYKMLTIITQRLQKTGKFLSDMVRWGNEASKRAITDELTGVYNRRYLDTTLQEHFNSSQNLGHSLSLIMIDLDYFREINEHYSNEIGNRVLCEISGLFKRLLKENAIIARYGGDEFTIILPNTDLRQARQIAEKIRREAEELKILENLGGPISRLTLSLGIASFPENARDLARIKEMADQALYRAKEQGRNKVIAASA